MSVENLKAKILNIVENVESNKSWLCQLNELTSLHCGIYKSVVGDLCNTGNLFFKACLLGDDDLVSYLIPYVTDINRETDQGSALYLSCKHGLVSLVDILLNNGARVCNPCEASWDFNCEMASDGFVLISNKDEVEAHDNFYEKKHFFRHKCCFLCTCTEGWVDILKMLIDRRKEIFKQIDCCKNVLKMACFGGRASILHCCIEMFSQLLTHKIELCDYLKSEELISVCLKNNNDNLIQIFIDYGCILTKKLIKLYPECILFYLTSKFTFVNNHKSKNQQIANKLIENRDDAAGDMTCHNLISVDWQNCSLCAISKEWLVPYQNQLLELDLSYNNLNILPSNIPWQMINLKSFVAMHSFLYGLSSPSETTPILCQSLEFINLSHNEMIYLPAELFYLRELKYLNVSHNCLQSLSTSKDVWSCPKMESLLMSSNDLSEIPAQLRQCTFLTKLCLDDNNISQFTLSWNCPLKYLDLSKNKLMDVNLGSQNRWNKTLTEFNVSNNLLDHIHFSICSMEVLEILNMSHNHIIALPPHNEWSTGSLKVLNLSCNKLGIDPASVPLSANQKELLMKLNQSSSNHFFSSDNSNKNLYLQLPLLFADCLLELDLSGNALSCVPEALSTMKELKRIDLSNNPALKDLPEGLCDLFNLEMLLLEGIEFSDVKLTEMAKNGFSTKMVQAYLRKRNKVCVQYHRLQVAILGKKLHGKTALCRSLEQISTTPAATTSSPSLSQIYEEETDENRPFLHFREINFGPSKNFIYNVLSKSSVPQKLDFHLSIQLLDVPYHNSNHFNLAPFFTPSCLFIVVFDLRLYRDSQSLLRTWLSIVQDYNMKGHVILVGTFLDCLTEGREYLQKIRQHLLKSFFFKSMYPFVEDVIFVSNINNKEGILHLRNAIVQYYKKENQLSNTLTRSMKHKNDNSFIPRDYIECIKLLVTERERRLKEGVCPILNEVKGLVQFSDKKLFLTKEDMQLALTFLVESGYLINFSKDYGHLSDWYFIDLQWLSKSLFTCLFLQPILKENEETVFGIYHKNELRQMFNLDCIFRKHHIQFLHDLQLLLAFGVIYKLYKDYYLVSKCIPIERPFASEYESLPSSTNIFTRIYKMIFVPQTMIKNLLVQLLSWKLAYENEHVNCLIRNTLQSSKIKIDDVLYWENGILLKTSSSCCLSIERLVIPHAESILILDDKDDGEQDDILNEALVVRAYHLKDAKKLVSNDTGSVENDDEDVNKKHVVDDTDMVHTLHILFALAIDFINDLIEQNYAELLDKDCYMDIIIPCPHCLSLQNNCLSSSFSSESCFFKIFDCIKIILCSNSLEDLFVPCVNNPHLEISLIILVPDLLLLDLPSKFHLNHEELPAFSSENILGRGGEGMVYKGECQGQPVAIKRSEIINRWKNYVSDKIGSLASDVWVVTEKIRKCSTKLKRSFSFTNYDKCFNYANNDNDYGIRHFDGKFSKTFVQDCQLYDCTNKSVTTQQNFQTSNTRTKDSGNLNLRGNILSSFKLLSGKSKRQATIWHRNSGVEVNEKKLQKDDFFDEYQILALNAYMSYRQETMTLARLRHPCLISLIGAYVLSLSYVMELSPLGSLRSVIDEKWNEIRFTVKYKMLTEIVLALKYLHEQNLVYKDMKPENLLVFSLTKDDAVCLKLSDYGLTRRLFPGGLRGIEGTCGYQAPEIWLRKPYNEKVDIFGFAMVAYELMEGDRSFFTNASVIINKLILQGKRPKIKSNLSPQLKKVVEKSWSQEPAHRPTAGKLESMLKETSTVLLKEAVNLQDSHIVGEIHAVCFDHHTCHLHMWTGKDTGRCYHTYNANTNQFVNVNICCPGSKVTHICLLKRGLLVLLTEELSIELVEINVWCGTVEKKHRIETSKQSTAIVADSQTPNCSEFYVISKTNEVIMYEVDEIEWNICLLHSLYLKDSSDDICLTAAHFVLQYLWVACGTNIYVLEKKARSEISVYQKISLFSECEDINFNISSICSFGEQIWCLIENFIVEIDSETFDIICFFDCSLSNFGETITNFNLNDLLRSLSNSDTLFSLNSLKDELGLSGLGNKDQIIQSCNINKSTLELEKSAKIRRKRSLRLFRGKRKKPNSKVIKNYRIKSIECCNGILWAGSISGEMILINVTQNSSSKVEYGQVLNVMCNEDNAQDNSNEDFQLSHMLKMPIRSDSENESESTTGSCSLMTMMSYKKKKLPHKRVRLLIWNCLDTIALHSFTGVHTQLNALINQTNQT